MPDSKRASKEFLFVNKDASSASLSKQGTKKTSEIRRHVQHLVQRDRRLNRDTQATRGSKSAKRLVGWQKDPAAGPSRRSGSDESSSGRSQPCPICRLEHHGQRCPSSAVDVLIGSAADPFECLVLAIDSRVYRILHFYMTLRHPAASNAENHIAGFTPLGGRDEQLSQEIIKQSLTSSTDTHILALLAGMACRMKFVSKIPLAPHDYPENYTVRAIRAFRRHIDAGKPVTDRVVLAMHNLSMAEYSCGNYSGAKLYWQMTRDMVILLGGFATFEPHIAWLCISADYLIAATTFSLPELDFVKYPKLSGLSHQKRVNEDQANTANVDRSAHSQIRLQVLVRDAASLTQTINFIRKLPRPASSGIEGLVVPHRMRIYRLITMSLIRKPLMLTSTEDEERQSKELDPVVVADAMVARARRLGLIVWLWYTSIGFLQTSDLPEHLAEVKSIMANHAMKMKTRLQLAENKLVGSGWTIREDLVLWLCSLTVLVSVRKGPDFFTARLAKAAKELDIQCETQLDNGLKVFPPLNKIHGYDLGNLYLATKMEGGIPE